MPRIERLGSLNDGGRRSIRRRIEAERIKRWGVGSHMRSNQSQCRRKGLRVRQQQVRDAISDRHSQGLCGRALGAENWNDQTALGGFVEVAQALRVVFGLLSIYPFVGHATDFELDYGNDAGSKNDRIHSLAKPQKGHLDQEPPIVASLNHLHDCCSKKDNFALPGANLLSLS